MLLPTHTHTYIRTALNRFNKNNKTKLTLHTTDLYLLHKLCFKYMAINAALLVQFVNARGQ